MPKKTPTKEKFKEIIKETTKETNIINSNYVGGTQISVILTVGGGAAWNITVIGKDAETAKKLLFEVMQEAASFRLEPSKGAAMTA